MNQSPQKDIIIYSSNDGKISFNVNVFNETIWLTQKQMAELFDKSVKTVSEHINNIFEERELEVNSTIRNFRIVQKEGDRDVVRDVEHYNLDAIISVGYRVKSKRGTQFRQWATQILKQYLMNGYVINEPRIRQIESSIDELVKDQKLLKEDVDGIKNLLLKLIERPVIIHNNINNQISLTSSKLEEKIIELLDQLIAQTKSDSDLKGKLQEIEQAIKSPIKDTKTKHKIIQFFNDLANPDSNLHKNIKNINVTTKVMSELINLGKKLKNLFE